MKMRALMTVLLLGFIALAVSAPASASEKRWSPIGLSRDGKTWSASLDQPLFDDGFVWVPGCAPSRTFYVRNQSNKKARLDVSLRVTGDLSLLNSNMFRMGMRTDGGAWHRVRAAGGTRLGGIRVDPGDVTPVHVRVRLLPEAANKTMNKHLDFTVEVRMTEREHQGKP